MEVGWIFIASTILSLTMMNGQNHAPDALPTIVSASQKQI